MSDVNHTTPDVPAVEPTATAVTTDAPLPASEAKVDTALPSVETTEPAAEEVKADAPTTDEPAAEKAVEPITEGQLAYKGPGLVKSLIPSKKDFWLSDDSVSPQNLHLFLRGEKPEISHPIVAWASQTGKGLLFFTKKNADRTHPTDVLALYDASDLKKSSPHEFSFKLNGQSHTFKATSDAERDGWYLSIEKAIELSKASKDEIRETEGYKAEIEKLNKPTVVAGAAKRSQSQPKKSLDVDKAAVERTGSSSGEEDEAQKKKSRSTSRGMFNRLKGKKDEAEQKVAEKKEDKEVEKEEKKTEETSPVLETTEAAPIAAAVAAAEIPAAAEAAEATEPAAVETSVEEKPKASKRGSIFGRVSSTWSGIRSPAKEKEQKDVELKPETPVKDAVVSENPPVLPETATTEPAVETALPVVEAPPAETKPETPKEAEVATPNKEKTNFLSGLGFMKRGRSVSPSTQLKEPAKKEEPAAVEETTAEPAVVKTEEPATEAGAEAEKPVEKTEEQKTETSTPNKRQSVLGSLGRRASKALNRMQAPKKENSAPAATEAKKEEATEVKPAEETPVVNGEAKTEETAEQPKSIGDVVPEAVAVGQPQPQHSTPTVAASA